MTPAVDATCELVLPRWARLKYCQVRQQWLLLLPERVLFPCPTTVAILERLGRPRSLRQLAEDLAQEYEAEPEAIAADIAELLSGLVEQGYVRRVEA